MENLGSLNEDNTRDNEQADLAQFITINNHQLRQPMYAMNLYLATLNTFDLPDSMRVVFDNLRRCAGFLDEIFLSLLDLASLHANAAEQKTEQFPITSVLLHIKNEFVDEAKARGLEFCVIPSSAWVRSDAALVKKMLNILTADAIRFSESGRLLIGCRRRGQNLRIAIYNSGNNLMLHRADFEAGESTNSLGSQFGRRNNARIGLALARELGQHIAAPLMFRSIVGRGSVTAFELPLLQSYTFDTTIPDPTSASDVLAHKFIVVIDDDKEILNAMQMLLDRWRCFVITASSCNEVLEKLSTCSHPPDALICDYSLGQKESGLDVIKILRAEFNQNTPALLITGETVSKLHQEARAIGVQALRKPLQAEKLYTALHQALTAFSV
jgi:CheY-like chemotaxis protein